MSRSVSSTLKAAAFAGQTGELFLMLLEITHADITTIRVVNNQADVVSNGETYTAFPFQVTLPDDLEDRLPSVQLSIDNVSRDIIDEIRTLTGAPTVSLSVILNSDPDTVEAGPFEMTLRDVSYDAFTISGSLVGDDILNEPYPGEIYSPQNFAGLFP